MTDYLVAVGFTRRSFVGHTETVSKAMRITATDPIAAGELGIDRTICGPKWMYDCAGARVISLDSHDVIAECYKPGIKPYGVARSHTRDQWRVAAMPDLVPA